MPIIIWQEVLFSASCIFCFTGKKPLEKQRVVVCYVAEWARLRLGLGKFTLDDIAPTLCTHLVYAFAVLNMNTNSIESMSPEYDQKDYNGTGWCLWSRAVFLLCHDLPIALVKSVTYVRGARRSIKFQFLLLL
jgi:chitinase